MRYQYILLDNDNTLMDFTAAEHASIRETLSGFGLPSDESTVKLYSQINGALWKALERKETTVTELKRERFRRLLEALNRSELSADELTARYESTLATHADLMPGAYRFVERLHLAGAKLALVSNGVSAIQRGRLSRAAFTPLLDGIFISEEIGSAKPEPLMLNMAMEHLGCGDKTQAVMVGDSMTSDMAAAKAAGIDSILLCPPEKHLEGPTWVVHSLEAAEELLLEGE